MRITNKLEEAKEVIEKGQAVVALTDTLYGILADALNEKAVELVYEIKGRDKEKPFIILANSIESVLKLGLKVNELERNLLELKGVSVILEVKDQSLEYLHRGKGTIAVRIPKKENLIKLLHMLNRPVIAPSCNPQGKRPARNVKEAIDYFGDKIALYVDEGTCYNERPSTLVKVNDGKVEILREGFVSKDKIISLFERRGKENYLK